MTLPEYKKSGHSRRTFIRLTGLIGAAIATGLSALYIRNGTQNRKPGSKARRQGAVKTVIDFEKEQRRNIRLQTDTLQKQGRDGLAGRSWVLVTDLSKCRNSRQCVKACQEFHQLRPEQLHLNTLLMKDSSRAAPYFLPKHCQHCDNPPCVPVCPVNATFKRSDGIVLIDNQRCIGCRLCLAACPYSARIFNWFEPRDAEKYSKLPYNVELNIPQKKGTVSKCSFSADKLRKGELPYCVTACPNGVYWFGDENEDAVTNGTTRETVLLSKLLRDNGGYRLMEELGQNPRVYYLPPVNRKIPAPVAEIQNDGRLTKSQT
jgi:molybdopterin-containing oxidoreductase family iron-sulfur binding subunit